MITGEAVEGSFDTLDGIVATVMDESGVPGTAVGVVYDDALVYAQGYGLRSVDRDDPVDSDTVFQLASLSKPISSTIMSGLVGQGVFGWDDPVSDYAPQFQLSGEIGAIAAGSDWETVSTEVLFAPAGMDSTSMRHDDFVAEENRAELHVPRGDREWAAEFPRDPDPQAPAGGVSSNVADLARWMRIQLNSGVLEGKTIIDPEALDQTHVPHITSRPPNPPNGGQPGLYGLGWSINTEFGGLVNWAHSGAFSTGANTTVKLVPEEGFGIVVLTNGAPVGVPEAIADSYIDYLITGEDNTAEWYETWSTRMGGVYGEPLDLGDEPTHPEPSAAGEAYEGAYANDYIGEVTITAEGDGSLEMTIGPSEITYTLEHRDANTFVYAHSPELPHFVETATFELVDDQALSLTLSAMNGAGFGTLERV